MHPNDGTEPAADTVVNESTNAAEEDAEYYDEDDDDSSSGIGVFFRNLHGQYIPNYAQRVITEENTPCIDSGAFKGWKYLEAFDMSKSVLLKIIGHDAFRYCFALALVKWPPNLEIIEANAFFKCTSLKEADMSASVALEIIDQGAFLDCSALALVKWPPNLNSIGYLAFSYCTSLKEADMSQLHALEIIGSYAFQCCTALAIVKWPPNLKTIGHRAFADCTSLKEADMSKLHVLETIVNEAFVDCTTIALVKWPPNLRTIGSAAFSGCALLEGMPLPSGLSRDQIGLNAFYKCQQLVDNTDADYWRIKDTDLYDNFPDDVTKVMIQSSCHWFVRKLHFDERKLQSVDMEDHDLKKAIRIKNLYPQATPRLTMNRLVSMYAKSPLSNAQFENATRSDDVIATEDWEEFKNLEEFLEGDLQRLEEIQMAYADSIFKLLHWYGGNGLVENLGMNRKKRNRDGCDDIVP